MVVKIILNKDKTTYQVVDEAVGDVPENRGKAFPTTLEAVNAWLYPNNTEDSVAKFLAEVPIIEEEPAPEPIVGKIPHGNIINMMMSRGQSPSSYYALTNWALQVLGYEGGSTDGSIPCVGYSELSNDFIAELNRRVEKIEDSNLLLTMIEMAEAGKRGYRGDKYNDTLCEATINACLTRLQTFDILPPSLWHKVHRYALWMQDAETERVSLPSPNGWISFSGVRPSQHGAWKIRMQVGDDAYDSPQYVEKMGLKAANPNQYVKGNGGVECRAFHLFNADGTLWGFEVYLISPNGKIVGCEVTTDGRFSLFRKGVYLPPRIGDVRQGDALFQRIDVLREDVVTILPTESAPTQRYTNVPREMQSVEVSIPHTIEYIEVGRKEHRHIFDKEGSDYWHPVSRAHEFGYGMHSGNEETRIGSTCRYEDILILNEDAVLRHPDHPSIVLKAGYYQILPVEGETDYQPPQHRGD